ncbi:hypothetical protein pb186bvf_003766 [Paramecium bursaria]
MISHQAHNYEMIIYLLQSDNYPQHHNQRIKYSYNHLLIVLIIKLIEKLEMSIFSNRFKFQVNIIYTVVVKTHFSNQIINTLNILMLK